MFEFFYSCLGFLSNHSFRGCEVVVLINRLPVATCACNRGSKKEYFNSNSCFDGGLLDFLCAGSSDRNNQATKEIQPRKHTRPGGWVSPHPEVTLR